MSLRLPFQRRRDPVRVRLRQADEARDRRDWRAAAVFYSEVAAAWPDNVAVRVQWAHSLKEGGDAAGAERAYRAAAALDPADADIPMQLGHFLRSIGRPGDAAEAYAAALRVDPNLTSASDALAAMGERQHLPDNFISRANRGSQLADLASTVMAADFAADRMVATSVYPLQAYDQWRHTYPVAPPPSDEQAGGPPILVVVDARKASTAMIRQSLEGLIDQGDRNWRAAVVAPRAAAEAPVGSFAFVDDRIGFCEAAADVDIGATKSLLLISAGTWLDPQAIAWFGFAQRRTAAAAVYCDHDRMVRDWRRGGSFLAPTLQDVFDPDLLMAAEEPPAAVMIDAARWAKGGRSLDRRQQLFRSAGQGAAVHIPRLLASLVLLPTEALHAPSSPAERSPGASEPEWQAADDAELDHAGVSLRVVPVPAEEGGGRRTVAAPRVPADGITVIIPTRDEAAMLARCVDSLIATAARADALDIVIVDNRSVEPETARLLQDWSQRKVARILPLDEPFNWSRANNLAAATGSREIMVFLNNDTVMRTTGWDDLLCGYLQRTDVGVVGGRLLYPDGTLQHAGMVFGVGSSNPVEHEGVGMPGSEAGPGHRWSRTRAVGAVTGACLAVRRGVFDSVQGFDERLVVAYNDVDFCLRVREAGLTVLYAPAVSMVHHESVSRGLNVSRNQVAWDRAELGHLAGRWGEVLGEDPGYNPHWALRGRPFDGFREPAMSEVLRRIDLTATGAPWKVGRLGGAVAD